MKKKLLLCLLIAAVPVLSFAQGCITIFSEDGDRFYLVLNGVKQNPTPQTNVRVDGLTNDYYAAKILFENGSNPEISKNMLPVKDPGTNDFAEVTYKIKRTKDGQLKLRYFSSTPVPVSYNPPPDMYCMHYGQTPPPPPPPPAGNTTVTQTTYTTTTANPSGTSLSINGGGLNMSVNVNDPEMNGGNGNVNMSMNINDNGMNANTHTTTTTTTTRSTSYSSNSYNSAPPPPANTSANGCAYPMDNATFGEAVKAIKQASFDDTKFSTAETILNSNCVSTDQVIAICKLFSFEDKKLEFAKKAYSRTTDQRNYFKVANVLTFDSNKEELNGFISGK